MHHITNEKAHGCDPVGFRTNTTSGADFDTDVHPGKAISRLIADLELNGYEVQALNGGGYVASTFCTNRHCRTVDDLYALALEVGAAA